MDVNALKISGINALMSIDNPDTLQKAVKSLFKTANLPWHATETEEKEEILNDIREGLRELKLMKQGKLQSRPVEELLNELSH